MCDSLDDFTWLYRGVPAKSPEVRDVEANGEIRPRRPANVGADARNWHSFHSITDTAYTSWTTDRAIAEDLARYASEVEGLSGEVVIFKVRIADIGKSRIFEGEDREDEFLIEGTVENVELSEDAEDEDEE